MHCIPRFLLIMHLVWTAEFFSQNMTRPSSRIPSRKGWGEVPACRSDGRRDFPLCFFHSFTLYFNFFVSCCLSPWFHPLIFLRTSTVQPSPFSFSLLLSFFFLFFLFLFLCVFGSFRSAARTGSSHQKEWLPLTGLSTRLGSTKDQVGWQPLQKQAVGKKRRTGSNHRFA